MKFLYNKAFGWAENLSIARRANLIFLGLGFSVILLSPQFLPKDRSFLSWLPRAEVVDLLGACGAVVLGATLLLIALLRQVSQNDDRKGWEQSLSQDPEVNPDVAQWLIASQGSSWMSAAVAIAGTLRLMDGCSGLVTSFASSPPAKALSSQLRLSSNIAFGVALVLGLAFYGQRWWRSRDIKKQFLALPQLDRDKVENLATSHGMDITPALMHGAVDHFEQRKRQAQEQAQRLDEHTPLVQHRAPRRL